MRSSPTGDGLIVDVPEQLSWARRTVDAGLTTFAVVLWLLALRPLLLLGIWYVGWQVAYTHMVKLEGWKNPGYFAALAAVIAGLSTVLLAWSRYNALRFRRAERRRQVRVTSDPELPARFALSMEDVEHLRSSAALRIERPRRSEVVVTCADGARFEVRHDPLGPRPRRGNARRGGEVRSHRHT